ncbi:hypothetical protein DFH09DRAFT_1322206 [Mycena vulgaris]|nr:hypothetical protein DFH09DRAFT_1322206 [Mycena vulgaris]
MLDNPHSRRAADLISRPLNGELNTLALRNPPPLSVPNGRNPFFPTTAFAVGSLPFYASEFSSCIRRFTRTPTGAITFDSYGRDAAYATQSLLSLLPSFPPSR